MSDEIEIRPWINKGGGMMVNAEALDITDPDHVYNQILAQGKKPEDYGFNHPYAELYEDKTHGKRFKIINRGKISPTGPICNKIR